MAAARAEARRKAILARGNDRLNKLTTSARGEDHPVYTHDDPPIPSVPSTPRSDSPAPAPRSFESLGLGAGGAPPDPSVWSEAQQRQFMQALMGGSTPPSLPSLPSTPGFDASGTGSDPLSALMAQLQNPTMPGTAPEIAPEAPRKPPTLAQKLLPLLHLLAAWALLAFFVLLREPAAWATGGGQWGLGWEVDRDGWGWGVLRRWGELGRTPGRGALGGAVGEGGYAVQGVAFFYAFLALQLAIHSVRVFSGFDKIQPPFLLSLALPHLPAPLPTLIISALKYVQMGGLLLDDVAGVLVGLGVLVWVGGWVQ